MIEPAVVDRGLGLEGHDAFRKINEMSDGAWVPMPSAIFSSFTLSAPFAQLRFLIVSPKPCCASFHASAMSGIFEPSALISTGAIQSAQSPPNPVAGVGHHEVEFLRALEIGLHGDRAARHFVRLENRRRVRVAVIGGLGTRSAAGGAGGVAGLRFARRFRIEIFAADLLR